MDQPCCDVCDTARCPTSLRFEATTCNTAGRRRRRAVKVVDDDLRSTLKDALLQERDKCLRKHPSYKMLGSGFVCPVRVIDKLCSEARFFSVS